MAVVRGTNCGFVTAQPTADPDGTATNLDNISLAVKDSLAAGSYTISELGWYQSRAGNNSVCAYEMGIYSHDAVNGRPNALIEAATTGQSVVANDTGSWQRYTDLSISIEPAETTTYWVALSLADVATQPAVDVSTGSGDELDYKSSTPTLPSSWGASSGGNTSAHAIYALYAASGTTLTVAGSLSSAGALSRMIHVARTYSGELMEWTKQLFSGWRQYVFNSMAQNFSEGR